MRPQTGAHWRDATRMPRFFMVDALAAFPLLLMLLHFRLWTFALAISAMIFFMILERFQFTVPVFLRFVKSFLAGPHKIAFPWWRQ